MVTLVVACSPGIENVTGAALLVPSPHASFRGMISTGWEGIDTFIDDLARSGAEPRLSGGHVLYVIEPLEGRWAGQRLLTAVEVDELAGWPLVPPRWIHLPPEVSFPVSNTRPSAITSWTKHSRWISGWGRDPDLAATWLAHVQEVVGEAR